MTAKYHIDLFWSEEDGAWIADVPDLQSCSTFGDMPMAVWLAVAREDGLPPSKPHYRGAKQAAG